MAAPTRAVARATAERDLGLRITPARHRADERPALRVVPATRRRRWGIVATIACAAVFAIMLGLTTFQARIAADQLQLDQLEGQVTDAQSHYEQLRLEVARLESPTRIVSAAKQLGMVQPPQPIYLSPDAADVATAIKATGDSGATGDGSDPAAGRGDWESMKSTVDGTP
jgi:cell division protein FtsL